MIVAIFSVFSIIAAIAIGNFRHINIGLVSIAFAFLIGYFMAEIPAAKIIAGWPSNLFFILLGMTLLFGIARVNGTLSLFAQKTVKATLGRTWLIPIVFFIMSGVLSALGPGNISICALVLPIAMAISVDYCISPLLMAVMVIAGSNAGGLSPIAPTGIIADSLSTGQGFDISMGIFYKQVIAQSIFAGILYLFLKGHRLRNSSSKKLVPSEPSNRAQKITSIVLVIVVIAIVFGRWNIGLIAFSGSAVLLLLGTAKEKPTMESVPWSTIILVCGVTMLVKVSENAGGIQLLSQYLTMLMNTQTVAPIMAIISGALSLVSSSSGVVMPLLIPTVPGLVGEIGGDSSQITSAIIIGAHMVTNSPISTLGALALSSAGKEVNKINFFNDLFLIGIAGVFYAALIVYLGIV